MGRPLGSKNKPKEGTEVQQNEPTSQALGEEPKSSAPPAYKSRLALINEISQSNKERQAAEDSGEGEFEPLNEGEQEPEAKEEEIEAAPEVKVEPAKQKFVLDGKEVEMTDEEVRVHVQKSATADMRMREAAKLVEDARRLSAPTQNQSRSASHLPNAPSASDAGSNGVDDNTVQEITKALMFGNEDEVRGAVKAVLGGGRQASQVARDLPTQTQGMTPEQVSAFIDNKLSFENAKKILETPKEQGGFSDVYNDPMLKEMFEKKDDELIRQGDKRPYVERYKAIGEEIRKWSDEFVKKHVPPSGLEDRDQLKRTTGVIRGAGGKVPTAPLTAKPKSLDDTVSSLRKSRGLN